MSNYRDPRYPYSAGPRLSSTAVYDTSFDTRFGPPSRSTYDYGQPRGGRSYYTPSSSRSSLDPHHALHSSQGHYQTRPRRNSSIDPSSRVSLQPLDTGFTRPLVRAHESPRTALPKIYTPKEDSERIIYPADSRRHHNRHHSATTEDLSRLTLADREKLERQRSTRYSQITRPRGSTATSAARYPDAEYSYTGPREQFERDYPSRRPRRDSYTRAERPVSMIDYNAPPTVARREPPLSSQKVFDRLDKGELLRPGSRSGAGSDSERDIRRHSSVRKPVSIHHHNERDEGYSSQRDDHGERRRHEHSGYDDDRYYSDRDRRHHHHRERRGSKSHHDRHESKERSTINSALAAAGIGASGLAAAAALKDRDVDPDKESRRLEKERRRQDRDSEREAEYRPEKTRDRTADLSDDKRGSDQSRDKSDSDDGRERRRHRRRHRDRPSDIGADPISAADAGAIDGSSAADEPRERRRRSRHRHHHHRHRDPDAREEERRVQEEAGLTESPVDMTGEESKHRKTVTVVEPPKEDTPELKPKGILKPPRAAFPEDPNPTREGVAPLKDAAKKGVPQGARWTKISRILVNPEALEAAQERFEERDDYVIVLRVLTREEVQKLADKTKQIREAREIAERSADGEDRRRRESDSDSDISSSDSYSSEEDDRHDRSRQRSRREYERGKAPLQIEAPPEHHGGPFSQVTGRPEAPFLPGPQPTAAQAAFQAPPLQQMQPHPQPQPQGQPLPQPIPQ